MLEIVVENGNIAQTFVDCSSGKSNERLRPFVRIADFLPSPAATAKGEAKQVLDLAQLVTGKRHLAAGGPAAAEKWAGECLYIDVYDPTVHVLLADARSAGKKYTEAIEEYETALELTPKKPNDLRVKLAQAQLAAGKGAAAKTTIEGVLKADPDHPEAKTLLQKINQATRG